MSHFSDIGFGKFEDKSYYQAHYFNFMNEILDGNYGVPEIKKAGENNSLHIYSLGGISYVYLIDDEKDEIIDFEIGYKNEIIAVGRGLCRAFTTNGTAFCNVQIEVDGIPFCFACLNAPIFDIEDDDNDDEIEFSVASFAESSEILSRDELSINKYKKMGIESYIAYFKDDPSNGFVSGIIKDFALEQNPVTKENYYVVDADCLGVHFKMLIDPKMVSDELEVGKVICGSFWNTAMIIAK